MSWRDTMAGSSVTDKRNFVGTVCVRFGTTRTSTRLELASAQDHDGPAGFFRVRVGRRWRDLPEGGAAYFSPAEVGALVAQLLGGNCPMPQDAIAPELKRGTVVSVANGRIDACGDERREQTRTATDPVRLYDGRWHVGVTLFGRGVVFVPVDDVVIRERR